MYKIETSVTSQKRQAWNIWATQDVIVLAYPSAVRTFNKPCSGMETEINHWLLSSSLPLRLSTGTKGLDRRREAGEERLHRGHSLTSAQERWEEEEEEAWGSVLAGNTNTWSFSDADIFKAKSFWPALEFLSVCLCCRGACVTFNRAPLSLSPPPARSGGLGAKRSKEGASENPWKCSSLGTGEARNADACRGHSRAGQQWQRRLSEGPYFIKSKYLNMSLFPLKEDAMFCTAKVHKSTHTYTFTYLLSHTGVAISTLTNH